MRFAKALLVVLAIGGANSVYAWDKAVTGQIAKIDVSTAHNYPFRVYLVGSPILCSVSNENWASLDDTDGNYSVFVSTLLAARAVGATVVLYTYADSNGHCKIGYIEAPT